MVQPLKNKEGNKIRTGKLITQACHASMGFIINKISKGENLDYDEKKWLTTDQKKIVLQASLDKVLELNKICTNNNIPCYLVTDLGYTEFNGPTVTAIAIGPYPESLINEFTKDLQLL